jgi:hypothetical protein
MFEIDNIQLNNTRIVDCMFRYLLQDGCLWEFKIHILVRQMKNGVGGQINGTYTSKIEKETNGLRVQLKIILKGSLSKVQ